VKEKVGAFVNAVKQSLEAVSNEALVFDENIQAIYDFVRGLSLNNIDEVSYADILALLQDVEVAPNDVEFLKLVLTRSKEEKERIEDSLSFLVYDKCLDTVNKNYLTAADLKNPDNPIFNNLLPDLALSA